MHNLFRGFSPTYTVKPHGEMGRLNNRSRHKKDNADDAFEKSSSCKLVLVMFSQTAYVINSLDLTEYDTNNKQLLFLICCIRS